MQCGLLMCAHAVRFNGVLWFLSLVMASCILIPLMPCFFGAFMIRWEADDTTVTTVHNIAQPQQEIL